MALTNEKVLDLVKKLFAQANDSAVTEEESIAFMQRAHKFLVDYKLENPLDKLPEKQTRIGKTIVPYPFYRSNAKSKERIIWFEDLAKIVAKTNFCEVEINPIAMDYDNMGYYPNRPAKGTEVLFVGPDLERQVCVFIFKSLANLGNKTCNFHRIEQKKVVGTSFTDFSTKIIYENLKKWPGDEVFIEKFMEGFISSIKDVFETKKQIGTVELGESAELPPVLDGTTQIIYNLGREIGTKVSVKAASKSNEEILEKTSSVNHLGDVYFLIDASGSMSGGYPKDKLEQAKEGAIDSAKNLIEQNYHVGLVRFESYAEHITSPISNIEQFERLVNGMKIGGSTNMLEGIRQAMYHFVNSKIRRIICIVTDGYPDSNSDTLKLAKMAKAEGIEITAIGTEDADHDFLKELCSKERLALKCATAQLTEGIKEMTENLLVA